MKSDPPKIPLTDVTFSVDNLQSDDKATNLGFWFKDIPLPDENTQRIAIVRSNILAKPYYLVYDLSGYKVLALSENLTVAVETANIIILDRVQ